MTNLKYIIILFLVLSGCSTSPSKMVDEVKEMIPDQPKFKLGECIKFKKNPARKIIQMMTDYYQVSIDNSCNKDKPNKECRMAAYEIKEADQTAILVECPK